MCREFTTIEHNEPLQKRFLKRSMAVLLMIEGNCLTFRSKPAHLVGHLPVARLGCLWEVDGPAASWPIHLPHPSLRTAGGSEKAESDLRRYPISSNFTGRECAFCLLEVHEELC